MTETARLPRLAFSSHSPRGDRRDQQGSNARSSNPGFQRLSSIGRSIVQSVTLGTDRGAKRLPRAVFVRILSATPGCGSPPTRYQSTGARYQFTGAPADEPPPEKETPLSKISGTRVRRRREGLGRGGTARARARRDAFARSRPPEPIAPISSRPTGTVRDRSRRVEGRRASRGAATGRASTRHRTGIEGMVHTWCLSEISADATEPKTTEPKSVTAIHTRFG